MKKTPRFSQLAPHEKAFVATALLLDGGEALEYVGIHEANGQALREAVSELLELELDVRLPFVGTMLRLALAEMK